MITKFDVNSKYASYCTEYSNQYKGRIGGNAPKIFEVRATELNDYLFFATIEHPYLTNKMISIFIPKEFDKRIENNKYPNCDIKVFLTNFSEESTINNYLRSEDLNRMSLSIFEEKKNITFEDMIIIGNRPILIQDEDFYDKKLREDGYSFFMQINEEGYDETIVVESYPFGFGSLYLYAKKNNNSIDDIIAGFWQFS